MLAGKCDRPPVIWSDRSSTTREPKGNHMNIKKLLICTAGLIAVQAGGLMAVDQTLNFTVPAVSSMGVSGDVTFAALASPAPGSNFTAVTDSSTSYSLSLNGQSTTSISAKLSSALPDGLEVAVSLAAPSGSGATSAAKTVLTTSDQPVLSGLAGGVSSGNGITYDLTADMAKAPTGAVQTVVTYTLVSSGTAPTAT